MNRPKRPRGWIDPVAAPPSHDPTDDVRELRRAAQRSLRATTDDRSHDRPRPPLLTVRPQNCHQLLRLRLVEQLCGGPPLRSHAHVERPVLAERESARRIVELQGRAPEIGEHRGGWFRQELEETVDVGEGGALQADPVAAVRERPRAAPPHGRRARPSRRAASRRPPGRVRRPPGRGARGHARRAPPSSITAPARRAPRARHR